MNNMINMDYYRKKEFEKKKIKTEFFDTIINLIIQKIKYTAESSIDWCLYEIPSFVLGCPNYTMEEISNYIINKFNNYIKNKDIEEIVFYQPNLLYIKWKLI